MIKRASFATLFFAGLSIALVACGGATSTSISGASESATVAPRDAASVITEMVAAGAPIALTVTYNETTDGNHLLGRPGQYTSKAAFSDSRAKHSASATQKGDVDAGGGVECFANAADAQKRATYIAAIAQSSMLNEYDFVAGDCLLRLSRYLTPAQAETNTAAFSKVMGVAAVAPTPVASKPA